MSEEKKENVEASRRDFLKKGAKLAVYAPPVMLAISKPSFATGWRQSGGITYPHQQIKKKKKIKSLFRRGHNYRSHDRDDD
jgi:hypothetical protein